MKRWAGAFVIALLGCVLIFLQRSADPTLLRDTDTSVLLAAIRQRQSPLSWFAGDWPLANHFYRPVSTLFFELDNRVYGNQAWGYGLTNALLCVACTLALFWFLRELTDRPLLTGAATLIFSAWQAGFDVRLSILFHWVAVLAVVGGVLRHRLRIRAWVPAALVAITVESLLITIHPIGERTNDWLPGRTATVMTLFALIATAAYARYERLSAARTVAEPTPLDPPATRNTVVGKVGPKRAWVWALVGVVATALALGSYEQAVMLPAILLATAVTMRCQGYRVRWGWQAAFWTLLLAYLGLRRALVPSAPSGYQLQQFRNGPGVLQSLFDYSVPSLHDVYTFGSWLDPWPEALLAVGLWAAIFGMLAQWVTVYQARRRWVFAVAGLGMGFLAFLPMAWVKEFGHYHYWPMALKSLLVATLGWIALELTASAWSPQTRQAPPRRDPAPGSLPRR